MTSVWLATYRRETGDFEFTTHDRPENAENACDQSMVLKASRFVSFLVPQLQELLHRGFREEARRVFQAETGHSVRTYSLSIVDGYTRGLYVDVGDKLIHEVYTLPRAEQVGWLYCRSSFAWTKEAARRGLTRCYVAHGPLIGERDVSCLGCLTVDALTLHEEFT